MQDDDGSAGWAHSAEGNLVDDPALPKQPSAAALTEDCGFDTSPPSTLSYRLGAVDSDFIKGRRPTFVELLITLPGTVLDSKRLSAAFSSVVVGDATVCAGLRDGDTVRASQHCPAVRLTTLRATQDVLTSRPVSTKLFEPPKLGAAAAPPGLAGGGGSSSCRKKIPPSGTTTTSAESFNSRQSNNNEQLHQDSRQSSDVAAAAGPACTTGSEVLTIKLTTSKDSSSGNSSTLGVVWDHALSDVGGIALLLSHVSASYCSSGGSGEESDENGEEEGEGEEQGGAAGKAKHASQPNTALHFDRSLQQEAVSAQAPLAAQVRGPAAAATDLPAAPSAPCASGDAASKSAAKQKPAADWSKNLATASKSAAKNGDGVGVVEWTYTAGELDQLKASSGAKTRHQAVFADVVLLLREASTTPIQTASISRDARGRGVLPSGHFGNATLITVVDLPPPPPEGSGGAGSSAVAGGDAAELASAIHNGIAAGCATPQLSSAADVHFTSWWHPLQRPLRFGGCCDPQFDVGPSSGAAAGRICKMTGKSNVTVLPNVTANGKSDGLKLVLRAPSATAAGVDMRLRQRGLIAEEQAALIWFHGLGDTAARWEGKFTELSMVPGGVRSYHPQAPAQHVTSYSEESSGMPSWFDVCTRDPIGIGEPEPAAGIEEAQQSVHRMIDSLVDAGMPSNRILIGGMSQGGALAIAAGLSYHAPLAGVVSMSGWCTHRGMLPDHIDAAQVDTPVFFSCGSQDTVVAFELTKKSGSLLVAAHGAANVTVVHAQRKAHPPKRQELEQGQAFMRACLE